MAYDLYLFDLDDTLLDFKASEQLSFVRALGALGVKATTSMYDSYRNVNEMLWRMLEQGKTDKEHLKVERFRQTFDVHGIAEDPHAASHHYLEALPQTVVLMEGAKEACAYFSARGEIGIITNGIGHVQMQRITNSGIAEYISFISVSDQCGYAKPDVRFFEYTVAKAKKFDKARTVMIGDRVDADIEGAQRFGIDSCWFNPHHLPYTLERPPTYEVSHLSQLRAMLTVTEPA